jgi:heavy metal sensor kinase
MSRSIRATLLGGYALILVVVIGTFGTLVYLNRHRTAFGRIDTEVEAHARALAATIESEEEDSLDLEYALEYARRFDVAPQDAPQDGLYFLVVDSAGAVLARSRNAPESPGDAVAGLRDRGDAREFVMPAPAGARVVVGCGTQQARSDMAGFLTAIVAAGTATLLVSLAAGWMLVDRILRPIRRMTQAAERISDSNLSERIDVGRTERELGKLAETLNGAFDRIEGAFERQTRFTADASHELRTPLSIVVANAECGLRRDRTDEEYREALGKCLRAGRRMTGVVDGLLVLARADAGATQIERRPVDLGSVVRDAVEFLAPLAQEFGVTVHADARSVTVAGDAERLRNAVENLVSNAIRYNRRGGRVDVGVRPDEGGAVLTVADTGVGIPAESLGRVFERFYRVDEARSRAVGGNGLGLAIAKWVIEAHGGRIDLASEAGVGTTVTVRLPVGSPSEQSATKPGPRPTGC